MMPALPAIAFTAPWLLVALIALPVIWLILRAVPPAPVRRRFPAVALLLGLRDPAVQAVRTPPWLLVLRMAALGALIAGFAGPVLNPDPLPDRRAPLLVVIEGGWTQAEGWPATLARARTALDAAARAGRPAALIDLAQPGTAPAFAEAGAVAEALAARSPAPWQPAAAPVPALPEGAFETLWLATGAEFAGRAALATALAARGPVTVQPAALPVAALAGLRLEGGALRITAQATAPADLTVQAIGPDPAGVERALAELTARPTPEAPVTLAFDLPPELRNRITRFQIAGRHSAGAVALGDDLLRRRKVGLSAGGAAGEGQALLAPLHYLRQALAPAADLIEGEAADLLAARPDVLILADIAHPPQPDQLAEWVEDGGMLIRFAGPNMAAAADPLAPDPLIPVRLRPGDRSVGGALSWGAPRRIAPFAADGPFAGLTPPAETLVRAQLVAEPDPDLGPRTLAALEDGTPLVTRAELGDGQVVLFHVTANADWSNLPISGLFVQMLDRLIAGAGSGPVAAREGIAARPWRAEALLDGFGALSDAPEAEPVAGAAVADGRTGPALPPGLYRAEDRRVAVNAMAADDLLVPAGAWPAGVTLADPAARPAQPLGGWLIAAALVALIADILASLAVAGRLRAAVLILAAALIAPTAPRAQAVEGVGASLPAADVVTLAHIATGDAAVDEGVRRGLQGLSDVLAARTTIEPGPPVTIDPELDELSLLTLIYWPVVAGQRLPSAAAYARLNRFLATGGMILFDTRDGDVAGLDAASASADALRALAAPLDIPPLAPIPPDHVLSRSFYLLSEFPGRYAGAPLWVAARAPDAAVEGGSVNDGVTPVIIGAGDWAAAWAVDDRGLPLNAVGRGFAGEDQREMAWRFGVNLVTHVLTGNYKADQVHVKDILERLGQ